MSALLAAFALRSGDAGATWLAAGRFLSVIFSMNLLLMVFNLLPFPPLNGSAAITLFVDCGTTSKYQEFIWSTPAIGFLGIFIAWQLVDFAFHPVFMLAVNMIYACGSYVERPVAG